MGSEPLTDMVVVLPGMLGSVLQKDGRDVWNPTSPGFLGGRLIGVPLADLSVVNELQPTGLIKIPVGLRGLLNTKGYDLLTNRLRAHFRVEGDGDMCSNIHEFAYDWRLDNRESAQSLKNYVEPRLEAWRNETKNPNAKVIFLAHSMGGLVCRYYLECLNGGATCRLLVSIGTPHRGAVQAIRYLIDGYTVGRTDVSDMMLKFPSIYQLLPAYPCLYNAGSKTAVKPVHCRRFREFAPDLIENANEFHREIRAAIDSGEGPSTPVWAIVGTEQPTIQRGTDGGGTWHYTDEMPTEFDQLPRYGDGTVPHIAAIPWENTPCMYVPDHHSFLHANDLVVENAIQQIDTMQAMHQLERVRGTLSSIAAPPRGAFSLYCEAVLDGELDVHLALKNANEALGRAVISIRDSVNPQRVIFEAKTDILIPGRSVKTRFSEIPPGMYEVRVTPESHGLTLPSPTHELVEI